MHFPHVFNRRYTGHRRPSATALVSDLRYRQHVLQEELAAMEKKSPLPVSSPPKPAMDRLTLRPSSPTTDLLLSPTRKVKEAHHFAC